MYFITCCSPCAVSDRL